MTFPVRPGCEAFRFDRGEVGVLLQHGFSGCPGSMRPIGEWLAERGLSVVGPRLPGHGTAWADLERTRWPEWEREAEGALRDLAGRCSTVVAVGQSVGGGLVLRLAARHPDLVHGVVAINPQVRRPSLRLAPLARLFVRTVKGVGNDIRKPGQDELAYDRIPLRAAAELGRFLRRVDADLPGVRQPLLVFSSVEDHVVHPRNAGRVMARAGSERKELVRLTGSYHVATLDYDAELLRERILGFALELSGTAREARP